MNLVNAYMLFIKNNIIKIINIIMPDTDDRFHNYVDEYIETYIKFKYFHVLETKTNPEDEMVFDFSTLIKEFTGKRIELTYENREEFELIDNAFSSVLTAVLILSVENRLMTRPNFEKIFDKNFPVLLTSEQIDQVIDLVKEIRNKEEEFFTKLVSSEFYIKYYPYKYRNNYFKVDLFHRVGDLEKYSKKIIRKNLRTREVALNATSTLINLLSIDIISTLKAGNDLSYYFIDVPRILYSDSLNINAIINMYDTKYVKNNIILLVKEKDIKKYNIDITKYNANFALIVDLSEVDVVVEYLLSLEDSDFKYIVCDKVKAEDYKAIMKYTNTSTKEIFISDIRED